MQDKNLIDVNLTSEMKTSFIDYAMSVIVARALPDVRDGLKPVHRRILYGMNELGVTPDKPHKKSARITGDVMGKYHPHGDSSIYEAMVRMAQWWSYRHMLVDGHGNFGSMDGDGAAAQRYTEARMSKIALEMLRDINKNTVDFQDNYDGSEREPLVLPSRFPNLLVNGATGIAVGMATNIPPHNLGESINAVKLVMDNPDVTTRELMEVLPGPDFPTGALVMGKSGIRKAYETGKGSIVLRSRTEIETTKSGRERIVVTEFPYGVNKTKIHEHIVRLAQEKRIEGITAVRDESSREGIRFIIEVRRDASANVILNNLFKLTSLQTNFSFNMLAIENGVPKILSLKQIIVDYIEHQKEVIVRRTEFDKAKAEKRAHILEGLLIALDHLDEVISIIRNSETDVLTRDSETMRTLSLAVESMGIELALTTSVADLSGADLHFRNDPTMPVVTARLTQYSTVTRILKRVCDIVLSGIAIILSSPIMLWVAYKVKREDGGPVFYSQTRIGIYGKPFTMYKFRSMRTDADEIKAKLAKERGIEDRFIFKLKDDPRVTKIGHFIRKTSLDEFPQFFNVFKGDMSLVGPRPPLPEEVARYDMLYSTRLLVKPGITGPWQISGRSDLTQEQSEYADVSYIQDWSITGDIAILLKTVVAVFKGTGSY